MTKSQNEEKHLAEKVKLVFIRVWFPNYYGVWKGTFQKTKFRNLEFSQKQNEIKQFESLTFF